MRIKVPIPRPLTLLTVALALAAAWFLWRPLLGKGPAAPLTPAQRAASREELAVRSQIERRLPEINFAGQGFTDVIDFLRDVSGSNIAVDVAAIEAAGIDKEAPVTTRLKDVRFSKALVTILAGVSKGHPSPLAYTTFDGHVVISTKARLDAGIVYRAFPVADLLTQERDPLRIAFGASPFTPNAAPQAQRVADLLADARATTGVDLSRIPFTGFSGRPVPHIAAFDTAANLDKVDAYLARRRRIPDVQAFALRTLALIIGSLLVLRLLTSPARRRRKRLLQNCCPACGYDLRATPERCPECGAAPAKH
jgi:hypothetical protein